MCERFLSSIVANPSKSLLRFRREMAQPRLSFGFPNLGGGGGGEGKIEGRHI